MLSNKSCTDAKLTNNKEFLMRKSIHKTRNISSNNKFREHSTLRGKLKTLTNLIELMSLTFKADILISKFKRERSLSLRRHSWWTTQRLSGEKRLSTKIKLLTSDREHQKRILRQKKLRQRFLRSEKILPIDKSNTKSCYLSLSLRMNRIKLNSKTPKPKMNFPWENSKSNTRETMMFWENNIKRSSPKLIK